MKTLITITLAVLLSLPVLAQNTESISETEKSSLIFMAQEEKVAEDFYLEMYKAHGLSFFRSISKSESKHKELLLQVMNKFGVPSPLTGDYSTAGKFKDKELQDLYTDLLRKGSYSVLDGLIQSARFEEKDIKDLGRFMESSTNEYVVSTFGKLKKVSENHLKVIVSNIKSRGADYVPAVLTTEELNKIMNDSFGIAGK
ncbi:MAG: DUF2202 domain-containing protein [Ignavibacteria bacterium]|nr:DUF2202 domain-containing protein [Ignavibacteria bacterium]